jgi:hypothetical protein
VLLVSRQGKVRLSKWIALLSNKEKQRIVKEVAMAVLARRSKMCNVLEHKGKSSMILLMCDLDFWIS